MLQERIADLSKFVEPDRVRREVYVDPAIFELEMQRITSAIGSIAGTRARCRSRATTTRCRSGASRC
jgi:hypothetical protein